MRIPCVRCLLREMDEQTALQQVLDFQRSVPKMEQADPSQYETRLAVCKACKWLNKGTSISLFIKLANPLFQSLFACFTILFAR